MPPDFVVGRGPRPVRGVHEPQVGPPRGPPLLKAEVVDASRGSAGGTLVASDVACRERPGP